MGKVIKSENQVLLRHVLEFLTEESERLDNAGIELLFRSLDGAKTARPVAKVMAVAASTVPQHRPPPGNPLWPPPARAQVSSHTPFPQVNNPQPAPWHQLNHVPNIVNNLPRVNPIFNHNYCTFCQSDCSSHNILCCGTVDDQ